MADRERETCVGFGEKDYLGLVSFGVFILVVGIVFVFNPNLISDFGSWIGQMASQQDLVRPPEGLISSAVVFFGMIGVSDFFMAGLRLWINAPKKQVLVDMLSGFAVVLFAYLIHLYGIHVLRWQIVLAVEMVAIGLLVVLYSIMRHILWT